MIQQSVLKSPGTTLFHKKQPHLNLNITGCLQTRKAAVKKTNKSKIRLIVIGASTGSPGALATMIPQFPANFPIPIILIVHLPDAFSASFANHLAKKSKIKVTLANEDEFLLPSTVYLSRADKHLVVNYDSSFIGGLLPYRLAYSDDPPVEAFVHQLI